VASCYNCGAILQQHWDKCPACLAPNQHFQKPHVRNISLTDSVVTGNINQTNITNTNFEQHNQINLHHSGDIVLNSVPSTTSLPPEITSEEVKRIETYCSVAAIVNFTWIVIAIFAIREHYMMTNGFSDEITGDYWFFTAYNVIAGLYVLGIILFIIGKTMASPIADSTFGACADTTNKATMYMLAVPWIALLIGIAIFLAMGYIAYKIIEIGRKMDRR